MTTITATTVQRIPDSDLMAHIQDTRLFIVWRHGRSYKRAWNELTATEKQQQREAEARASYCAEFGIYGGGAA